MFAWSRCKAKWVSVVAMSVVLFAVDASAKERIKDIAAFDDDQNVMLIGTGLVTGLTGTGDRKQFSASIEGLVRNLERLGITVDPKGLRVKNVAMVQVIATVRSSSRVGAFYDVNVSSIGDATSLEGGVLQPSTMAGITDGVVYGTAAGPVSIGGFNVDGGANNRIQRNHTTVGIITNGGQVMRGLVRLIPPDSSFGLLLNHPDRTTATNVAKSINEKFPGAARAADAGYVKLTVPPAFADDPVGFQAAIEKLQTVVDARARVVVNERTGTIVVGGGVQLREAAVAHGSLTIEIRTRYRVSQPNSFNDSGETVVVPDVSTYVNDAEAHVLRVPDTTTVQDIVDILNGMGATPRDIIAMLQALKAAGSLQAEVEVI
jgi:flagellar P-ring protein FlgI